MEAETEYEQGIVKFYDDAKGWGFIIRKDYSEAFVHYSGIQGRGRRSLVMGQPVKFIVEITPRGPVARQVVKL